MSIISIFYMRSLLFILKLDTLDSSYSLYSNDTVVGLGKGVEKFMELLWSSRAVEILGSTNIIY